MEILFWPLLDLILMTIGILCLFAGIKLCAKRSITVKTRIDVLYASLLSLFYLFLLVTKYIVREFDLFWLFTILISLILSVSLFFINKFNYSLEICNIAKDVLYNCVLVVFEQLNIEYDIKHEKRYSKLIYRNIDASVTIHFSKIGSSLRFIKPNNIPALENLIDELQQSLRGREFKGIPTLGITAIIFGFLFTTFGLFLLYKLLTS